MVREYGIVIVIGHLSLVICNYKGQVTKDKGQLGAVFHDSNEIAICLPLFGGESCLNLVLQVRCSHSVSVML